ncbi:MAG: autotransporter assembly complex family protein [Chromatocurvus sp.]
MNQLRVLPGGLSPPGVENDKFRATLRPILALLLFFACGICQVMAADLRLNVSISGLNGQLRDNVRAHLGIVAASDRKAETPPTLTEKSIRRLHKAATAEIEAALRPFGFYSPVITASLEQSENAWRAIYAVDAGPATQLRNVTLAIEGEGKDQPGLERLIARAALAPGKRLNHPAYEELKNALRNDAYALGYLDSGFRRSSIEVYPDQQVADLALVLDTGPRFYFGDITVEQSILSQAFIDKFVSIRAGEPFEPRRLTNLQLALTDSPYFSQVEVTIQRDQTQDQRVPVRVATTESKSQRYETSVGYGTDTGPRGGAGILWRRINQHGHQFRTDFRLSAIQSTLASQYKIPIGEVGTEYLDFTADAAQRSLNDVDATSYAIGSSLNQNRWGGRRRATLALRHEVWAFGDNPNEDATLLAPGLEFSRIVADDLLFTRRGYSAKIAVTGAVEELLSDTSFLQAKVSGRYIHPLGPDGRLLVRGEYGATMTDEFNRLPPSQRFFNGGAQNVRGYGFEELSPRDDQRNIIGGRYLGTASVEVDYLVYGNIGLALFVDAGNASNSAEINWKSAAGIGLRYKSPVGMFRLDFAHPFDDPDSSFALHISFGPDLQ